MKRLEFKCEAAIKFVPYDDFYWQKRSMTVLSKWYHDVSQSVSYSGVTHITQSVPHFGSRLMYNPHLFGINTVYATQTKESTARSYRDAYSASAAGSGLPTSTFLADDYTSVEALWNSSKLPERIYEQDGSSSLLIGHSAQSMTASFVSTKNRAYKRSTSQAMQNYFCEIENFYGVNRSVIKSVKEPETPDGKFKLKESLVNSEHTVRDISMYVVMDNDYMPTTNLDFIGPWPWYANMPYGGLGMHTADVFNEATEFDGFEVSDTPNIMARSHLNVEDRRLLKITFTPASDALEELSFGEFLTSASYTTIGQGFTTYGGMDYPQVHPMDMQHNLVFDTDRKGRPYVSTKGENITAILDASSASFSITAMSGTYSTDVPGVATVSSFVSEYSPKKGIYLKILGPNEVSGSSRMKTIDGDISAAKLFGLSGTKKVGDITREKFIEEAVVMVPLVGEEGCKHEPVPIDEEKVLSRLAFLQKTGQLRFNYFSDDQLDELIITRDADTTPDLNFIDDIIFSMEKYVYPPEMDFLLGIRRATRGGNLTIEAGTAFRNSISIAPYFAAVFSFSKNLTREERISLWQGRYPDSLKTSRTTGQTISVPIEEVFGENFKFEDKNIRAMVFRAKFRAETNFSVYSAKKTDSDYNRNLDYDLSYNWPYDQCTILPLNKITTKIYCKEED